MLHSLSSAPSINGEMAVICVWNSFMWFNMMDRKLFNWWVYKEFTWNLISEDWDQVKLPLIANLTRDLGASNVCAAFDISCIYIYSYNNLN